MSLALSFVGKFVSTKIFMKISKGVHDKMVLSLTSAQLNFFEENTHGRIVNRFSKDM